MGVLAFWASVIQALAWPATVLIVVLVFRRSLATFLTSAPIKRLKAGPSGVEMEYFDQAVKAAKGELEQSVAGALSQVAAGDDRTVASVEPVPKTLDEFMAEMHRLAEISPSAVVMESFARLETFMRREIGLTQPDRAGQYTNFRALTRRAVEKGLLTEQESRAVDEARVLRNAIVHTREPSVDAESAIAYANLIRQIVVAILVSQGRTILDGVEEEEEF